MTDVHESDVLLTTCSCFIQRCVVNSVCEDPTPHLNSFSERKNADALDSGFDAWEKVQKDDLLDFNVSGRSI